MYQIAFRPDATGQLPTAAPETIWQYQVAADGLVRQCASSAGFTIAEVTADRLVEWFNRQNERWAASTIVVYRRGVQIFVRNQLLEAALSKELHDHLCGSLYPGPRPRCAKKGQRRTASQKRRTVTQEEARAIFDIVRRQQTLVDSIIMGYVSLNSFIGLRPSEWLSAKFVRSR